MGNEPISPNLHVALIHFPLALLVLGTFIELFAFLWRGGTLRIAGRWMILLGALLAIPATFTGIYALSSVARMHNPVGEEAPWAQVKMASPLLQQPIVWHQLRQHMLFQSVATGLAVFASVVWLGLSDRGRRSMHFPLLLLLFLGTVGILSGAWFGGESVYQHGVGVDTSRPATAPPPQPDPLIFGPPIVQSALTAMPPLLEVHALSAGFSVAIALGAIGLSFRKVNATYEMFDDRRPIIPGQATMAEPDPARTPDHPISMIRSFNPDVEIHVEPFAPAARFWLLGFLLALMTAAGGVLLIARDCDAWETHQRTHQPLARILWDQIAPVPGQHVSRLLAHAAAGVTIVLTPLLLAVLARFAPRRRFWLSLFSLILLLAVGVQIWLGILLLLDTSDGPVTQFNPPLATASP
jgi:uncharacterized membrane protein